MNERRKVLELFEAHKDFVDTKVNKGIEKNRKGDAKITVTDKNGNPIEGAKITASQKSHEFKFGANIFMLDELETAEKNEKYKKHFADLFNMATLPFYWDALEPEQGKPRYAKDSPKVYRRPSPDLCIEFCEKHGIEPREHALAYDQFFPKWIKGLPTNEVKDLLKKRYKEISERYADKIPTIEVTNEMSWTHGKSSFYDENDYVLWCFKLAGQYFPSNQLVINDTTNLSWNDKGRATDKYFAYIEANILKGAPIDAIGMQYHLFNKREVEYEATRRTLDPTALYRHMDLYASLGKPLQITEVTVPAYSWEKEDEEIQAEIIEKLYSIWFSHPAVEQIIYWNLVDGYAHFWDPDPAKIAASQGDMTLGENYYYGGLFRFDLSPKPAYYKIKELLQERWHTEAETVTNENGTAEFRGFFGKYDVTVELNGKKTTLEIDLSKKENNNFTLKV